MIVRKTDRSVSLLVLLLADLLVVRPFFFFFFEISASVAVCKSGLQLKTVALEFDC